MLPKWQDIPPQRALKLALSREGWLRAMRDAKPCLQILDETSEYVAVYVSWKALAEHFPEPPEDVKAFFGDIIEVKAVESLAAMRNSDLKTPILVWNTNNLSLIGGIAPAGLIVPLRRWKRLKDAIS